MAWHRALRCCSAAGGGLEHSEAPIPFSWRNCGRLLSQRQILGASIGQFCGKSTLVFFLTWFPTYLVTERGMGWLESGMFAVMPHIAASVGLLIGGLLLASTIIAANYDESNTLVIAIMSAAFFDQGMVNLGWTLISDVAPKQFIGLTGGVFNLCANLAGIVTPIVIGLIVGATQSFYGALSYVGVPALIGAAAYIFIIGDVYRVELDSAGGDEPASRGRT